MNCIQKRNLSTYGKKHQENKYAVPTVNTGTPLMHFAKAVGEFIANNLSLSNAVNTNTSAAVFGSSKSNVSDSEGSLNMDQDEEEVNNDIPAKDDFPLCLLPKP